MKKRVLVFCEFYRPGYKSGGGMWTVVNLVDRLRDSFDFAVVTRNHDGVGDRTPYSGVDTGKWTRLDGHKAYYMDPSKCSIRLAAELVEDFRPDAVFVNSVFGVTTRVVLEARRKRLIGNVPVVVAPCGELSTQCLAIKPLRKSGFLRYAKLFGLYNGVLWKATSELEAEEIRKQFGADVRIAIAPDIVPTSILPNFRVDQKPAKLAGKVKLVSVARLAPKKNLLYLLECLSKCGSGEYELELIGQKEKESYWEDCKRLIEVLPDNVTVNVLGALPYTEVLNRLVSSHFFVLPTLNENFGYVMVEAMAAGCPLLISENTIWSRVQEAGAGRVLRLDTPSGWIEALESCAAMDGREYASASTKARAFALNWLATSEDAETNAKVLESAIAGRSIRKVNVERA